MDEHQTPEACFNKWKKTIGAIPADKVQRCIMPDEVAMHEGARAATLVHRYRSRLVNSAIDPACLDTIGERSEAFTYCTVAVETLMHREGDLRQRYLALKNEGYALRRQIRNG